MDRVSSRLGGLAVWWRPRPSGTRQYISIVKVDNPNWQRYLKVHVFCFNWSLGESICITRFLYIVKMWQLKSSNPYWIFEMRCYNQIILTSNCNAAILVNISRFSRSGSSRFDDGSTTNCSTTSRYLLYLITYTSTALFLTSRYYYCRLCSVHGCD